MMKCLFTLIIFMISGLVINAQAKIPESIKANLTLKPSAKPYESTGFVVEKGAILTLLPGVKINMSIKPGEKANFPIIDVLGTIKVGMKGAKKSSPVVFTGSPLMLKCSDATIEMNGFEAEVYCVRFFGNNNGTVQNCSFIKPGANNHNYNFVFTVPSKGNLTFENCLIENQGVDLNSSDFPNNIANLTITKCAFTTRLATNKKKYERHYIPITLFAYGTKCDNYLEIEFKAFDWDLKKALETEWYIQDERVRKVMEDSVKSSKLFSMKLPAKPFTTFKQVELPGEDKKDKK